MISLGPVQDFIASARRTRDLYAGSQLLSMAAGAAAEWIGQEVGFGCLIFPAAHDASELERMGRVGVPNVVLAQVPGDPRNVAEGAVAAARDLLRVRAEELFEPLSAYIHRDVALQQVDDLLEAYWVAAPLRDSYAEALERVQTLLRARKATRDFRPVPWGSDAPKSSLDGARESVFRDGDASALPLSLRLRLGWRPGEALSGVDLLKRLWAERQRFASTAELAARPFLAGLGERQRGELFEQLRRLAEHHGLRDAHGRVADPEEHPHLLFPSRWRDFMLDREPAACAAAVRNARAAYRRLGLREPSPYYAVLVADGDRMGATIDRLAREEGVAGQRRLSRELVAFAEWTSAEVARREGSLVYSGGDDVLALLPLHTALECAASLSAEFACRMEPFASEQGGPTLSVGIAIVHFLEPLQDALALAREAERMAKNAAGRNALALTVSPRSGSAVSVCGSWAETPPLHERLKRYVERFLEDAIPDGAAFQLDLAARILGDDPEAALVEGRRIITRKDVVPEVRVELERDLLHVGPGRLARERIVARYLVPAWREARGLPMGEGRPCG